MIILPGEGRVIVAVCRPAHSTLTSVSERDRTAVKPWL